VPVAGGYLRALSWGVPGAFIFIVTRAFSEAVSMTRPVMLVSFLALAANVFGNYVFMYGHLGMPRLGAVGTGVATACVWWLKALAMTMFIKTQPAYRRYQPFARFEFAKGAPLLELLRLGLPIAVSLFMEGSCFAIASLLIGRLGVEAVAGHQVALNFASYMFMVPLGISIAISVRVGQACGARNLVAARRTAAIGAHLCALFMTGAAAAMVLVPQVIVSCYTPDQAVQPIAIRLLGVAALFQIFDGLQVAGAGALRGLKDTKVPMLITTAAYWVIGLPTGAWLGLGCNLGAAGFWYGFCAGLAFAAAALNWRFRKEIGRQIAAERIHDPRAAPVTLAMAAEPTVDAGGLRSGA
jgi:MATE family multidrug resistance protein